MLVYFTLIFALLPPPPPIEPREPHRLFLRCHGCHALGDPIGQLGEATAVQLGLHQWPLPQATPSSSRVGAGGREDSLVGVE